jgi:lipopolysaccharide/colanic/teichoic acid biosynthesis glycosyltransferase
MGLDSTGINEARETTDFDGGNGLGRPQRQSLGGTADAGVVVLDAARNGYKTQHDAELRAALGLFGKAAKRGFDLIGSLLLVTLLAPLWIAIAVLIKADSPGPILFRQRRIGRDGLPFGMLKFRTMVNGADARKPALLHLNDAAEGLFKINDDPRTTKIGGWLRATCLDELPQLVHVLSGKMSLVGPRPLVPEEDARIRGEHRRRHSIRPGMTGPWQVAGASAVPIYEMVAMDRTYLEQWSPWLDVKLIAKTASLVIRRRGR